MTPAIVLRQPLRVALVGCGRWGGRVADALAGLDDFALAWVCDPAVKRPGARWAPSLDERVCRDVDAVVVATPPEAHLGPTLAALRAHRPVLVEKPFVQSAAEMRQVRAALGETPILVGHLLAYHAGYQALGRRVASAVGPIRVEVVRRSPSRGGQRRCPWWTLAPHDLALLTRWFGEPTTLRVASSGEDVQARLTWTGVCATLSYSTVAAAKCRHWRVVTSAGEASFDELSEQLTTTGANATRECFAGANPLRSELLHLAECVRHGTPGLTGIDEAEQSVRLLCLGERQLRPRRGQSVSPFGGAVRNP